MKVLYLILMFATYVVANTDIDAYKQYNTNVDAYEEYNCQFNGEIHEGCPTIFGNILIKNLNITTDQFIKYRNDDDCFEDYDLLNDNTEFICYYDEEKDMLITEFLYQEIISMNLDNKKTIEAIVIIGSIIIACVLIMAIITDRKIRKRLDIV